MLDNLIVIGNNKGGAKKSTLTAQLAGEMHGAGWKVLVVDLDLQGDLGKYLFWRGTDLDDQGRGLHDAMIAGEPLTSIIKNVGGREGFDAIPGGSWIRVLGNSLRGGTRPEADLLQLLTPIAHNYNAILVDTQPSPDDKLHQQALLSARYVISPVNADEIDSIERYAAEVERIRQAGNPLLEHLGQVLYGWDRGQPPKEADFERFEKAANGVQAFRSTPFNANGATKYARIAQKLVGEYAIEGERVLRETGSGYGVSKAGLNITVFGKRVTQAQRAKLPEDAEVIGDVLLGGGLAGDYFALGREIMAAIYKSTL